MSKRGSTPSSDQAVFDLYDKLDRYEELLEDLAELGVTSAAEAEAKVAEINAEIDLLEADDQA